MSIIKDFQEVVPFLSNLSFLPKLIVSFVVVAIASFVLIIIWMPTPEKSVENILSGCYRRAMFTRMHAQIDTGSMFSSIGECRKILQAELPKIKRKDLQGIAVELLSAVERIERLNSANVSNDFDKINKLKLIALNSFQDLAKLTGGSYPLPDRGKLAEAVYFTKEEADLPPSIDEVRSANTIQ